MKEPDFFWRDLKGLEGRWEKKCTSETGMHKIFDSLRELLDGIFVAAPGKKISINGKLLKDLLLWPRNAQRTAY